jgi:hypothetical protein
LLKAWLAGRVSAALLLALLLVGCETPDPQKELQLLDLETYWAINSSMGTTHYISPVVRFRVKSLSREPLRSVEATVAFKRKGEENLTWGTDWQRLTTPAKPFQPGQSALVVLKSDARYYSQGSIEGMLAHAEFKDAKAVIFLKVGASGWSRFAEAEVERRIGSKSVEATAP